MQFETPWAPSISCPARPIMTLAVIIWLNRESQENSLVVWFATLSTCKATILRLSYFTLEFHRKTNMMWRMNFYFFVHMFTSSLFSPSFLHSCFDEIDWQWSLQYALLWQVCVYFFVFFSISNLHHPQYAVFHVGILFLRAHWKLWIIRELSRTSSDIA